MCTTVHGVFCIQLWMGTHPRGPSAVSATGQLLSKWIEEHPESLGSKAPLLVADSVGQLPFLFKILSVSKSLSIQTHPSKVCMPSRFVIMECCLRCCFGS